MKFCETELGRKKQNLILRRGHKHDKGMRIMLLLEWHIQTDCCQCYITTCDVKVEQGSLLGLIRCQ